MLVLLVAVAVTSLAAATIAPAGAATGSPAKASTGAGSPGLGGFPALRCQDGEVAGGGPVQHVL